MLIIMFAAYNVDQCTAVDRGAPCISYNKSSFHVTWTMKNALFLQHGQNTQCAVYGSTRTNRSVGGKVTIKTEAIEVAGGGGGGAAGGGAPLKTRQMRRSDVGVFPNSVQLRQIRQNTTRFVFIEMWTYIIIQHA